MSYKNLKIITTCKVKVNFEKYGPTQLQHPDIREVIQRIYGEWPSPLMQPHQTSEKHLEGCYVGYHNGEPFGKFALYDNPELHYQGSPVACLGSYECIDDPGLGKSLLNHAEEMARARGSEQMIGPMEGSTWNSYRLVEDWQQPAFFSEPVHQGYYLQQFQDHGFMPIARFHSQLGTIPKPSATLEALKTRFEPYELTVRHADLDRWEEELAPIATFTIEQFSKNFLYTPLSTAEFIGKYLPLKPLLDPELILIAEDQQGKIRGLCFLLRDHLAKDTPQVIIKTLARDRDARYKGLGDVLTAHQYAVAWQKGYQKVLHAFMKDNNASLRLSHEYAGQG